MGNSLRVNEKRRDLQTKSRLVRRRRADSDRWCSFCRAVPYHLATSPHAYASVREARMERETGIEPATFSLARRCSTTEPLPLMRYFRDITIAYQKRFVNILIIWQSKQTGYRDIFVNCFPVNPPALSNQFPLLTLFISSMIQPWEPAKRGTNLTSIGKTHMETLSIKVNMCCKRCSIV